jgi:hypothetical protein
LPRQSKTRRTSNLSPKNGDYVPMYACM